MCVGVCVCFSISANKLKGRLISVQRQLLKIVLLGTSFAMTTSTYIRLAKSSGTNKFEHCECFLKCSGLFLQMEL